MSAASPGSPRRHACLRASLRAYPAADRDAYGADLLDAAEELAEHGSTLKEVGGLLGGGLAARTRRGVAGLRALDRQAAAERLVEPLTGFAVAIWGTAAVARMSGPAAEHLRGSAGVTAGSALLMLTVVMLLLSVARRQRLLAIITSTALFAQVLLGAGWNQWRGDLITAAPPVQLYVGPWWFGPSLSWALLPFLALLVVACWGMSPAPARLPGRRRPLGELTPMRLGALLLPAVALGAVLAAWPNVIIDPLTRETSELPGIVFLMALVSALWIATSVPGGRDDVAAAAALVGLAAAPSVAYGFADLITPTLDWIGSPSARLGLVLALSVGVVGAWVGAFVAVLAAVGLRSGAGAPRHSAGGAF